MKLPPLVELVTLQQPVKVRDDKGGEVVVYQDVEAVWIGSAPLSATEALSRGLVQGVASYLVAMRYRTDVTTAWRLQYADGRVKELTGPPVDPYTDDPPRARRFLRATCVGVGR